MNAGGSGYGPLMPDVRTRATNVLVIGAGGGGLRAAIAAHEAGTEVLVVSHRAKRDAHTILAAGGINAALGSVDPEDTWEQHAHDTLVEGHDLGDPAAVELLTREAPQAIDELARWGCDFARTDDGRIDQRFFGAHTYRRTCYVGDWTGRAVLGALADRADGLGIEVVDGLCVSHLLVSDEGCFGALGFDLEHGTRTVLLADAVVLATGGHTRLWQRSSSRRDENTGDGMALALRAGCRLANLELVQFHPTGLVHPEEWAGTLVTEAVRGAGGHLLNADGERFMERYEPERMELAARDRVALACYTEIAQGRGTDRGAVLLDVTHLGREVVLDQLPQMRRQLMEAQLLDIVHEPMEVAPTAHYTMGGIVVDPESHACDVAGLYAVGECTSGVHGANRLGGNSLAEIVVFGRRVGEAAARFSRRCDAVTRRRPVIDHALDELDRWSRPAEELALPVLHDLRAAMWEGCGVQRDHEELARAAERLDDLGRRAEAVDGAGSVAGWTALARSVALRSAVLVAQATVRGATERSESRGAHQRRDHPEPAERRESIELRWQPDSGFSCERRPVPAGRDLGPGLDSGGTLVDAQRLLE
jgi:succinate dehydrogenase / fumarate reductase, flavoprotein subunit